MAPWDDIEHSIGEALDAPFRIEARHAVGGGCINTCYRVQGSGLVYFVKVNEAARRTMFEAEAAGLAEIARSGTVRVPNPVCHGASRKASWLVLEYLELRAPSNQGMRELGLNLARMHRVTGDHFGWSRDNTIGATPQLNAPAADWVEFWRERRLGHQLRLAAERGYRGKLIAEGERLLARLPELLAGHSPRPSLLHGDLWSGNVGLTAAGMPVIYDPAVYYGDREADLAMTELFGGFAPDFYSAYREAFPLDAGYARRKPLYNLYHVLNHANLFGGGYGAQAERMIGQLLADG